MSVIRIAGLVRQHFTEHSLRWKLQAHRLAVDYVPSPGGFGPMNFSVSDGETAYHVKLNNSPESLAAWVRASEGAWLIDSPDEVLPFWSGLNSTLAPRCSPLLSIPWRTG